MEKTGSSGSLLPKTVEEKQKPFFVPISEESNRNSKGILDTSSLSLSTFGGTKNEPDEKKSVRRKPFMLQEFCSSPTTSSPASTVAGAGQTPQSCVSLTLLSSSLASKPSKMLPSFGKGKEIQDDHKNSVGNSEKVSAATCREDKKVGPYSSTPSASSSGNGSFFSLNRSLNFTRQLQEEFRQAQLAKKAKFVKDLVIGRGFGDAAEITLKDSYYVPSKVLGDLSDAEKKVWGNLDFLSVNAEKKKTTKRKRSGVTPVVSFEGTVDSTRRVGLGVSPSPSVRPLSGRGSVVFSVDLEEGSNDGTQGEKGLGSSISSTSSRDSLRFLPEIDSSVGEITPRNDDDLLMNTDISCTPSFFSPEIDSKMGGRTPQIDPRSSSLGRNNSSSFLHLEKNGTIPLRDEDDGHNTLWEEDSQQGNIMEKFRCTYKPINAILETRMEIIENIRVAEKELERICAPFTLEEVLETLSKALKALERGYLSEKVTLPMLMREKPSTEPREREKQLERERKNPIYLVGAQAVLDFVRAHVLPVSYEVATVSHSLQWMLQYTMTFLQSLSAQNVEEAQIRVQLLSQCVRIIASTENVTALSLSLVSKGEEYDSFEELKISAEEYFENTVGNVEKLLESILRFPFPSRREELQKVDQTIQTKLRHALVFLNEIDTTWVPVVYYQMKWKRNFLSSVLKKVHCHITVMYMEATMGFVDKCLYELMKDNRCYQGITNGVSLTVKVPRASLVEYERVTNKMKLEIISVTLKGIGSRQVGLQLCMGARYILQECGAEFDEAWGFSMHQLSNESIVEGEKRLVENMYEKVRRYSERKRSNVYSSISELSATAQQDEE